MNEFFQSWGEAINTSLQEVGNRIVEILPNVLGALVIILIGVVVAVVLKKVVEKVVRLVKLDDLFAKTGLTKYIEKTGVKFSFAKLLGWMVKWFVLVVFFLAASETLGLNQVTAFINELVLYIPNVIVAVLILAVGALAGDFLSGVVHGAMKAGNISAAEFTSTVTRWAIWVFSILAALVQLGIAVGLIQTLFAGIVGTIALAAGLAFGLGGRDIAGDVLSKVRREIKKD